MPGANYMGGRRNAAKARVRDADGRLQKSHFGRQRLAILGKGLGKALAPDRTSRSREEVARVGISLAHAHKPIDNARDVSEMLNSANFCAYSGLPVTPPRKRQKLDPQSSSGRSRSDHASSILKELDTTEPLFMRATIARLLDQPDFAGLSLAALARKHSEDFSAPSHVQKENYHEGSTASEDSHLTSPSYATCTGPNLDLLSNREASYLNPSKASISLSSLRRANSSPKASAGDVDDELEAMPFDDDGDVFSYDAHNDSGYAEPQHAQPEALSDDLFFTSSGSLPGSSIPSYGTASADRSCSVPYATTSDPPLGRFDLGSRDPLVGAEGPNDRGVYEHFHQNASLSSGWLHSAGAPSALDYSPRSLRFLGRRTPGVYEESRQPQFISDFGSPQNGRLSPLQRSESSIVEETLADAVHGRLFEDTDPLLAIRTRLGLDYPSGADPPPDIPVAVDKSGSAAYHTSTDCTTQLTSPSSGISPSPQEEVLLSATKCLLSVSPESSPAVPTTILKSEPAEPTNRSMPPFALDSPGSIPSSLDRYIRSIIESVELQSPQDFDSPLLVADTAPADGACQSTATAPAAAETTTHAGSSLGLDILLTDSIPPSANGRPDEVPIPGRNMPKNESEACLPKRTPEETIAGPPLFADDGSDD